MRVLRRLQLFAIVQVVLTIAVLVLPVETLCAGQAEASAIPAPDSSAAGSPPAAIATWIAVFPAAVEDALRAQKILIWQRDPGIVIAGADGGQLEALAAQGIEPGFKLEDTGEFLYLLSHAEAFTPISVLGARAYPLTPTADLYVISADQSFDLPHVKPHGAFRGLPRIPLPPIEMHEADKSLLASPEPFAPNPLVTQLLNTTSQAAWFQYVKDLSGENSVVIGGNTFTIRTRYSFAMYPTPALNAYASEYLLDKGTGWGYTGARETYTSTNSGCASQSTNTWQNIVFTLPGQIDIGQHQQVIFVTHHDSLSFSSTESANYAPGADDAISGGSALLEALRVFKGYGFKNTVKIIFFSGEEQGLCGSIAYTRQHTLADMWRVVNMDQTAYDGNRNGWMDCYNWDSTNSPQSVALGQSFIDANSDYGNIITPANIFRPTNHMCQTDHCPFWDAGVAAIAVTEDLFHNEICPCFDQSQSANCHDTVTQDDPNHPGQLMFDQNFSWPSEKAAIATVAHLAEPLYACPVSPLTLTATPDFRTVHLSWPASSVTNAVVERAASCAGPFTPLVSATGTTYDDANLTNGTTYAYRLRTCPTQTSACVAAVPNGPNVRYQAGSAIVTADSGDHDGIADNCELVTVHVNLVNDGNMPLTGVKVSSISSTHGGVQVASVLPQNAGAIGIGGTAPVSFKFYLGRNGSPAGCGQNLPFTVTATSDQSPVNNSSFSLGAERNPSLTLAYDFETSFSGWTVSSGSFSRVAGGAPGSTAFSLHSENANNACDAIVSPLLTPTAQSALTLWVNYGIEGNGNTTNIWDRAVVRVINQITLAKTLLVPTGVPYNTTGTGAGLTLCDGLEQLSGWAGSATTWQQAAFDLSSFAGIPIKVEVRFATNGTGLGSQGFWFDSVQITNPQACDNQTNNCAALPAEVSPDASPVQFTLAKNGGNVDLRFSEVAGATRYNIYGGAIQTLRAGTYDHAAAGGICSLTDATAGDGQVTATLPLFSIPDGAYLLAVAQSTVGESVYGHRSTGATIPLALDSCP